MDSFMLAYWVPFSIASIIAFVFLYNLFSSRSTLKNKKVRTAPMATGAWPVLGHLHLFGSGELPHKMLAAMADKYGSAFRMKFGKHTTLVVSDTRIVKECFTTNDTLFSNRPSTKAFQLMTYDNESVAFTPYGPFWREIRKISTLKLLSNHRLQAIKDVRASEVNVCFKTLHDQCKNPSGSAPILIDMKKWFEEVSNNVVMRVIVGRQNFGSKIVQGEEEAIHYKKVMDELLRLASLSMFSDFAPLLGFLDIFQGNLSAMKQNAKKVDAILENWLEEHRKKKNSVAESEQDFMDVMLSIANESKLSGHDADTVIKATCLAMIMGGTDTTAVSLTWIISLLMNNRHALKKAREELDAIVGKDRQVEDSDLKNLVYMNAIVKETMRMYPLGTLLERDTKEDCEIGGFHVKGGTRLLVNVWKLQRDPNVWVDPTEFRPERFLSENADIDVGGQHFELLPFGAGRRVCPGVSFALQFMHLVLARLIHGYDLNTLNEENVDLTESPEGHVNHKASPLDLILTPRLHYKLYE
uniref:Putative cytochrome P450 n=1 Tax=Eschscholzia californica subsp. californica TaxID=222997 RepID=A0A2Z6BXW4_ESCCA|nr:putative cytochrome P450 [Eschscholzia californica subsp. californica]